MGTTEKKIEANKEVASQIEEAIKISNKSLTKWTKIMATAIIIQTVTLIVINLLK